MKQRHGVQINWRVRLRNKNFWLALVPAACLLASQLLNLGGVDWEYDTLSAQLTAIVGTVFAILALLGVVDDPTTPGFSDSARAMKYTRPGELPDETRKQEYKRKKHS